MATHDAFEHALQMESNGRYRVLGPVTIVLAWTNNLWKNLQGSHIQKNPSTRYVDSLPMGKIPLISAHGNKRDSSRVWILAGIITLKKTPGTRSHDATYIPDGRFRDKFLRFILSFGRSTALDCPCTTNNGWQRIVLKCRFREKVVCSLGVLGRSEHFICIVCPLSHEVGL